MKQFIILLILAGITFGCGKKNEQTESIEISNEVLYDSVMFVHDEVMPKMNDIYKLKEQLKKQIADTPDMVEEKRKEVEAKIAALEEAGEGMMRWMREFNPPADSLGEEAVHQYLQSEMEKVKKVKADIQSVLQ